MAGLVQKLCGSIQMTPDLSLKFVGVAGLNDDLIEAGVARKVELALVRITCRGNKRDSSGLGIGAQMPSYIAPGQPGQFEVKNDQIGQQSLSLGDRLLTIARGRDAVAPRSQVKRPDLDRIRVVIHNQNVLAVCRHTKSTNLTTSRCMPTDVC